MGISHPFPAQVASRDGLAALCRAGEFHVNLTSKQASKDSEASLGLVAALVGSPSPWCEELQARKDGRPDEKDRGFGGIVEKLVHGSDACAKVPWGRGMPFGSPSLADGRVPWALYPRVDAVADCGPLRRGGGVNVTAVLAALPAFP